MKKKPDLDLSQVTLVAVDSVWLPLTARALRISMSRCHFGDAILFTNQSKSDAISNNERFRVIHIPEIQSNQAYSEFILNKLCAYIQTPFVQIIQWDGYVIDPDAWAIDFLNYDYIGARWPWQQKQAVGNGGFSLRSRKLMQAIQSPNFQLPTEPLPEDVIICQLNELYLEQKHQIRFAPPEVADAYSFENIIPEKSTFGFHGLGQMWRSMNEEDVELLAENYILGRRSDENEIMSLMTSFYQLRNFRSLHILYSKFRNFKNGDPNAVYELFAESLKNPSLAGACIQAAENDYQMRLNAQ